MRVIFVLLATLPLAFCQDPCANAPTAAAKVICRQLHKWDENSRTASTKKTVALPPGAAGGFAAELAPIAATIYQCLELGCVCTYLRGTVSNGACTLSNGQPLQKAVRKEYRMMTDDERARFHNVLNQLKQNGEYTTLARIHAESTRGAAAHSGPAFLPWHREYMKRVELAIRQIDPTLYLPYWDSTLDGTLPRPADSIIFTDDFGGLADAGGNVLSGPFANWRTLEGRGNILRAVGREGGCFKESEINYVLGQRQIDQIMAYTAGQRGCPITTDFNCLEYTHGNVHIFVGGDMYDTDKAANDPLFFMHHSFVDYIWEQWRQQAQARNVRETAYPPDNQLCSSAQHFAAATLNPFGPFRNNDGLSNAYTDNMYEFAPRPVCPSCGGSKWLFCDPGSNHCAAKVRVGGSCAGIRGGQPCYNGECQGGVCVATVNTRPPVTTPRPVVVVRPTTQETCFNENECCATWMQQGECTRNAQYMRDWCKASCRTCVPTTYSVADDCRDRHINCAQWSRSGECTANPLWMTENCRQSCNACTQTRAQKCGGRGGGSNTGRTGGTTTPTTAPQCENTVGCYNEDQCCSFWARNGECSQNPSWMACNCRVSCGHCFPQDYNYGGCEDYNRDCPAWSRTGECQKNPWTLENCRTSCRNCLSFNQLMATCPTNSGDRVQASRGGGGRGGNRGGGRGGGRGGSRGGGRGGWGGDGGWGDGGWGGGNGWTGDWGRRRGGWGFGNNFWGRK